MSKDYYKILEVDKGASKEELKKAFRKKAHEYHPDKQTGNEAKFKEVNEAYQVLSDDQKRAQYDRFGSAGPQFGGGGGGGAQGFGGFDFGGFNINFDGFQNGQEFDLNDIFSAFGGGGFGGRRVRKGRDIVLSLDISFKESILGVSKTIKVPQQSAEKAKGEITVKIPAGVEGGQMVRLSGYGEPVDGGQAGDLLLKIYVDSHKTLRKEGIHVVSDLKIKITDAMLGATYDIEGVEGPIKIKIPKGIQSGKILRIKGGGVPAGRFQHGDLLVVVTVEIPDSLTREQKKLIEELQNLGL